MLYKNIHTEEVWKLSSIETIRTWKNEKKVYLRVYVFENGERWAEDLIVKHWVKLSEDTNSIE